MRLFKYVVGFIGGLLEAIFALPIYAHQRGMTLVSRNLSANLSDEELMQEVDNIHLELENEVPSQTLEEAQYDAVGLIRRACELLGWDILLEAQGEEIVYGLILGTKDYLDEKTELLGLENADQVTPPKGTTVH